MSTNVRAEVSEKNKYWISRHRYYELKHFCMQYPFWKKQYLLLKDGNGRSGDSQTVGVDRSWSDPTAQSAMTLAYYSERIEMVENTALEADAELFDYILKGVTKGLSYESLNTEHPVPCSRDVYYDRYRKFFWLLSNERK